MSRQRRTRAEDGSLPEPNLISLNRIKEAAAARHEAEANYNASLDALAYECVQALRAGVPSVWVAEAADTSRMTLRRWMQTMGGE